MKAPAAPRVLMITWEYPPCYSGGAGTACAGMVCALQQLGTEVGILLPWAGRVIGPDAEGAIPEDLAGYDGAGVYSRGVSLPAGDGLTTGGAFDLIHCHDWPAIPAGMELRRRLGIPLIVHIHSLESDRSPGGGNRELAALEADGCRRADRVIAVSRYTAGKLAAEYGVPADKIRILYNGFEPAAPGPGRLSVSDKKTVLFLGRFTRQKGPDIFLDAALALVQARRDVVFVMAGAGPMEGELRFRAGGAVSFAGFVPRQDVPALLDGADILAVPSRSEPFGLAALEAMARGVTVVITRTAGLAEIAHNLLALDRPSGGALGGALNTLLDAPGESERIGRAAAREATGLGWDLRGRELSRLYAELTAMPRS